MRYLNILVFLISALLYCNITDAQGGGPPMIIDDPAVVDFHTWEINSSIKTSFTDDVQLAAPSLDINYGVTHNLHFKIESAYVLTLDKQNHSTSSLGDVIFGIKYHFLYENKSFLSAGIFPQLTVTGDNKGLLFPLLLVKTIGRFVIDANVGVFVGEHKYQSFQDGILIAYQVSERFQIMAEYFMEKGYKPTIQTEGYMNYGCRYRLNNTFTLMGSLGSQIVTPANEQKEYFYSFLGVQSDF